MGRRQSGFGKVPRKSLGAQIHIPIHPRREGQQIRYVIPQPAHIDLSHCIAVRFRVAAEIKAVCEDSVVLGEEQHQPSG